MVTIVTIITKLPHVIQALDALRLSALDKVVALNSIYYYLIIIIFSITCCIRCNYIMLRWGWITSVISIIFSLQEQNHWELDKELLSNSFTSRTKLIVVNTPHNPTSKVFSRFHSRPPQFFILLIRLSPPEFLDRLSSTKWFYRVFMIMLKRTIVQNHVGNLT